MQPKHNEVACNANESKEKLEKYTFHVGNSIDHKIVLITA